MPWRRKPAHWIRYWNAGTPSRTRADGFRTVLVYCVGPANPRTTQACCNHTGRLQLDELPEWGWSDISAHLRCTQCGTVGYVDTRLDWSEVIDFNKGTDT